MTSFSEILDLAKSASSALNALEESSHAKVLALFGKFDNGLMSDSELRLELRGQAQSGFITAGSLAVEHVHALAVKEGLPRFDTPIQTSAPVLDRVLADITKNIEVFQDSDRGATALRRLRFRAGLSVQTAVRRGFTENQLAVGSVLRAHGATLKKVWLANFVNNTPCPACLALHGTELSLSSEFPHGGEKAPRTFLGLQGPPRHPNCHCYMLVFVVTLDTVGRVPQAPVLEEQKFMHSRDVRRLPRAVYTAAVTTLRLIAGKLKAAIHGKR
jgi:hypothetical protein